MALLGLAVALGVGCGSSASLEGQGNSGGGSGGDSGLPCDVDALLAAKCRSCHSNPPTGGAPIPLETRDDLLAKSKIDATKTVADRVLLRMQDSKAPMPPAPPLATAEEIAAFKAWVDAGTPVGSCTPTKGPFDGPPVCTSMQTWNQGNEGDPHMNPGMACITCHSKGAPPGEDPPPVLLIGGTVYPTGHEPDLCMGGSPDPALMATVEITGKDGAVTSIPVLDNGNFLHEAKMGAIATPFTAKVIYNGKERAMSTPQTSGDCNSCHTQAGANGAPGRIVLP
jgi:hypothetical protein